MNTFIGLLSIPAFIFICLFALVANEDAALQEKYVGMDQALYSIMSR